MAKKVSEIALLIWQAYTQAAARGWGFLYSRTQRALTTQQLSELLSYSERQVRRFVALLVEWGLASKLSKRRGYILHHEKLSMVLMGG